MNIRLIDREKYCEFIHSIKSVNFLQSEYQGDKMANDVWNVEYIEAVEDEETIAVSMLAFMPLAKIYQYCYIPRGFFIDYHDAKKVKDFTEALKAYLLKKNVMYMQMDPAIDLVERDINGDEVADGYNNQDIVENLKNAGFIQLPLKRGYDISKECRWVSVLDLRGKNADEIFSECSYQTRQDIRTFQKYCVKTRKLKPDELHILDSMEQETSKRRNFHAMSLEYYQNLYKFYGDDHIETVYAYLDIPEYENKIQLEFDKTEKDLNETKAFLETHPDSVKKQKRLKTDEEYYNSLKKKLDSISALKELHGNEVPLACSLFIKYSDQIVYLVGASDYEYRVYKGPYAIQWRMINEAIADGYDYYNFYGISGLFEKDDEGYGVFDFKRGFHAVVHEYIGNFILPVKNVEYKLYSKLKGI